MLIDADRNNGDVSGELWFNPVIFDGDIGYFECTGACPFDESATGCHLECARFVASSSNISSAAIIKATSYQYEPLLAHDNRRGRWLRSRWGSIISSTLSLPLELGDQVAQHCLREFAIVYQIISLDTSRSSDSLISNTTDIWVRYTVFEGVKYVASLTTHRPKGDVHAILLSTPELPSTLCITEDHLGIRDILFASSSDLGASRAQSDIWWRTPQSMSTKSQLQSRTDVSLAYTLLVF